MAEPDPDSHYAQPLPAAIITAAFFCSDLSRAANARTRQRHGPIPSALLHGAGKQDKVPRKEKNGFQVHFHTCWCILHEAPQYRHSIPPVTSHSSGSLPQPGQACSSHQLIQQFECVKNIVFHMLQSPEYMIFFISLVIAFSQEV